MDKTVIHIAERQSIQLMRLARRSSEIAVVPSDSHTLDGSAQGVSRASDLQADALLSALHIAPNNPLELLVPNDASRRWTQPGASRLRTKTLSVSLPKGSFLELRSGVGAGAVRLPPNLRVFLCGPGLATVECARQVERSMRDGRIDGLRALLRVLLFVDEFCGSYVRHPFGTRLEIAYDELDHPTRLCSKAEMEEFLQAVRGVDGIVLARRASSFAIDGSGSPMESYVNHAFVLPPRYGGLSMPQPLANRQLQLDEEDRRRLRHLSLRPDLQWPEYRTLAEYLGEAEHSSHAARVEDKNRMQDYATTPYAAFPLMYDDVRNAASLNRTAQMLARELMKRGAKGELYRMRKILKNEEFLHRQRILIATMLPPVTRFGE